jgi:hypothetical protein
VLDQMGKAIAVQIAQSPQHCRLSALSPTVGVPGRGWVASKRGFYNAVRHTLADGVRTRCTHSPDDPVRHTTALPHNERSTYHRRPARRSRDTQQLKLLPTGQADERKPSRCRPQPPRPPRPTPPCVSGRRRRGDPSVRSHVNPCVVVGRR